MADLQEQCRKIVLQALRCSDKMGTWATETAVDSNLLVDMSADRDQMLRALESLESEGLIRRVGRAFALPL